MQNDKLSEYELNTLNYIYDNKYSEEELQKMWKGARKEQRMSKELCPCGMSIECRYVVTRKDGTKFCSQDMNCFASNRWLVEHDSELLDKVAEKLKAKYPLCFNEFGMTVNDTLHKNIDEVIAEMKAEIEE